MARVRKISSLSKLAPGKKEYEGPADFFQKQTNPAKVKVDVTQGPPQRKYPVVKEDRPGERVIDLEKELSPNVRQYMNNLVSRISAVSDKINQLEKDIKERQKKIMEKDKPLQRMLAEKQSAVTELFTLLKDLMNQLAQYKAIGVKRQAEVAELQSKVEQVYKLYVQEVKTGKITTKGFRAALQRIEEKFNIVIDKATKEELEIEAMGTQIRVVFEQIERLVEEANESTSSEVSTEERTASLHYALSLSYIKELAEKVFSALKGIVTSLISKVKELISTGKEINDDIAELNKELDKLADSLVG